MAKIERKFMAHYVDAAAPGDSDGGPTYVRLGKDLEEYSPELSANVEKKNNILGETSTMLTNYEKSGSVEPYYAEKGDALFERLQAIVDGCLVLDDCNTTVVEVHLWEEEDPEKGFFFYMDRCDLVKIVDGKEYIITTSYGSANTREGRTGSQSPYDGANSALKMAQKRSLVSAALSLGCMSDSFTQDIESDQEDAGAYYSSQDPEAPITAQQRKFFYTRCGKFGLSKPEAKELLRKFGYDSASKIKTKDFDALIESVGKED